MIQNFGGGVYLYTADNALQDPCRLEKAAAEYFAVTGKKKKRIRKTPEGKPYFEGEGLYLSPSHTGAFYAVAFAPFPIGLDTEPSSAEKKSVAERYFSPLERPRPFSLCWTVKEAVSKLTGEGLGAALRTRLSQNAPEATLDGVEYRYMSFTENGYRITLARRKRNL